ncbi:MAG: outer membrane protein assembly factor BamB [Pseudomonadota bacterium]
MTRFFALLFAVSLLAGCSSFFDIFEDKDQIAELPQFQAGVAVQASWKAQAGSGGQQVFVPALAEGAVYLAAADGELGKYDLSTGRNLWRIRTKQPLSGGVGAGSNLVLMGSIKGGVFAYDSQGKPLWQARVPSEVLSPPQVADGVVVVRSNDGSVSGLDAASGARKWIYQRPTPALTIRAHAGAVLSGGVAYVGFAGGRLAAIELANGNVLWEVSVAQPRGATELERVTDITSLPVVDGRQVCAVAYQGRLACFQASNGDLLWAREVSSIAGMADDGDNLYVVDSKGAVLAYDKRSGASVWKQDKLATRGLGTPVVYGKYVVMGDYQGYVHFLAREDGALVGRFDTDGSALPTVPLPADDRLLVQTRGGSVYALELKQS